VRRNPQTSISDRYLVIHCVRCDAPMTIFLEHRSHPAYCPECFAIVTEATGADDLDARPTATRPARGAPPAPTKEG